MTIIIVLIADTFDKTISFVAFNKELEISSNFFKNF